MVGNELISEITSASNWTLPENTRYFSGENHGPTAERHLARRGRRLRNRHSNSWLQPRVPLKGPDVEKLAYFFDFDYVDGRQPGNYVTDLIREVESWATLHRQHRTWLDLQAGSVVLINEHAPCAVKRTHVLSGVAANIHLLCDASQTVTSLALKLGSAVSEREVCSLLAEFLSAELMGGLFI